MMSQIALPLSVESSAGPARILVGSDNADVIAAFHQTESWPFRAAILFGPPRSGKSLLARWFAENDLGDAIDDAETLDEADLFHRWNRAQESGRALLMVKNRRAHEQPGEWRVALPDLASRLGAALRLTIGAPDDAMLADLIAYHAERRGIVLDETATAYLVPRCERSHLSVEKLVAAIDRLSLERKQPPTLSIWRDALEEVRQAADSVVIGEKRA